MSKMPFTAPLSAQFVKVTVAAGATAIFARFITVDFTIAMLAAYSWSATKKLIVVEAAAEAADLVNKLNVSLHLQKEYPPYTTIVCPGPWQLRLHSFHLFYHLDLC